MASSTSDSTHPIDPTAWVYSRTSGPYPEFPDGSLNDDPHTIGDAAQFSRFVRMKKEWHEKTQYRRVPVRCLIDESTSHTLTLGSVIEMGGDTAFNKKEIVPPLGISNILLPGRIILRVIDICLIIHEQQHFISTWIVDKLFPEHEGVDIHIVLGRGFLRYCPGLILRAMIRGQDSVDLVPWNYSTDGHNLEINPEGELIVYVCGYSKMQGGNQINCIKEEKGGFGVFFGPNSKHNMSMKCTTGGFPQDEVALMEGIIYTVLTTILGRWAEGSLTFTSVCICIDSKMVFDVICPRQILEKYQKNGWKNVMGERIGMWEIFQIWVESIVPVLEIGRSPWMKGDMIVFERVRSNEKGIQAARHLAISSLGSYVAEKIDRGSFNDSPKREWVSSLFTYVELFSWNAVGASTHYNLQDPNVGDFIRNRKVASKKGSNCRGVQFSRAAQAVMDQFFISEGVIGIYTFWRSLETSRFITGGEILAMSKQDFIEQVIKIGKDRGRLMDDVQWQNPGNRHHQMAILKTTNASKSGVDGLIL